ncbi:hypothetical protein [Fischerella thermalis]|uniref:hypothetical protein n=1 Tax=Fischerella thermalis TaxID=372787 RepID=UPI0011AED640|nr:hypothetical protein [Fischerella thermalis]
MQLKEMGRWGDGEVGSSKLLTANYQCTDARNIASLPTNYYQLPITQYAFASPDRTADSQKLGQ